MNKKILKLQPTTNIFDDIQRYLLVNNKNNVQKPSTTVAKHSKSLHYYSHQSSGMKNRRTNVATAQQTINAQILVDRKKPSTSQYSSGKRNVSNFTYGNSFNHSLKGSLRGSTNYNSIKLESVAGVTLNQQESKVRKQRNLNSRQNFRKIKLNQIQKQNKRISSRLNSQQSNYSSKKLLKSYQSQQSLSKRLSSSKLSNRSALSQNSSRSKQSTGQSISTPRNSEQNRKLRRRLNQKQRIQSNHQVKIQQHNIHKMDNNNINKIKNLFSHSFNHPILNLKAKNQIISKQRKMLNQERKLMKDPYIEVKLTGITQISKGILNKKISSEQKLSVNSNVASEVAPSNLLKQLNRPQKVVRPINLHYQSLSFDNGECGGLLHRIAEEMHENDKSAKNIRKGSLVKPQLAKVKK